ncbi:MAG: phosphoribosylamine--glycine ligase [Chloroflexi bacterium]|nr:phosphoribosylamine--glycine ligase [Chloroflexota bacterium]
MFTLLILGSGAREHALAWKLAQSPQVRTIFAVPGNAGTAREAKTQNIPIDPMDFSALLTFAREREVDFVVVGPEAPLAAGVVDAFARAGIPAFGPSAAAARIESSKAFARDFMARYGVPAPRYRVFEDVDAAMRFLRTAPFEVVIKASGLAAGKGVIVPQSREEAEDAVRAMLVERRFGEAGARVLIEERLFGQEVSVLAFCDGERLALMPPAQDHKAVFDGDRGPNTGGMGAYAPAPLLDASALAVIERDILRPVVRGMAAEGTPYRGALYAGLMITSHGPKVLEFNCRFGDPEAEVILPLFEGDLLAPLLGCATGALDATQVRWRRPAAAACVVAAAPGYPGPYPKGAPIHGLESAASQPGVMVFHAGTTLDATNRVVTNGGRVLAVTAWAQSLPEALERAYQALGDIRFEGMHYRRDIGARALNSGLV